MDKEHKCRFLTQSSIIRLNFAAMLSMIGVLKADSTDINGRLLILCSRMQPVQVNLPSVVF